MGEGADGKEDDQMERRGTSRNGETLKERRDLKEQAYLAIS